MDDRRGAACVHDGFAVAGGLSLLSPNVALMHYLGPRNPIESFHFEMIKQITDQYSPLPMNDAEDNQGG